MLSAAAHLQRILPDAVLAGGTAAMPTNLGEYKNLAARWHDWNAVRTAAADCAVTIFDRIIGRDNTGTGTHSPENSRK